MSHTDFPDFFIPYSLDFTPQIFAANPLMNCSRHCYKFVKISYF